MAEKMTAEQIVLQNQPCGKTQVALEGKIEIPQKDLKKVLQTTANGVVKNIEVLEGVLNANGEVVFCAIYINDVGQIKSANLSCNFMQSISCEKFMPNVDCIANCTVVDSEIVQATEDEIKMSCVVEISSYALSPTKLCYIQSCDDQFVCKKAKSEIESVTNFYKTNFETIFNLDTKTKISQILHSHFCILPKKIEAKDGSLLISGQIEANIVCLTEGEEGLNTICESVDFAEEVALANLTNDAEFQVVLTITESKAELKEGEIEVNLGVRAEVIASRKIEIESVVDAFAFDREVNISVESTNLQHLHKVEDFDEKIATTANVDFELNKVIGQSFKNLVISNVLVEEGYLTVEGIANITVFCEENVEGESEEKSIASCDVEIPFSIKNFVSDLCEEDVVLVKCCLADCVVKHRRTNELDVNCILKVSANIYKQNEIALVCSVELGDEKTKNDTSISLYICKQNDTAFDVCKKFGVSADQMAKYNSDLAQIFAEDGSLPEGTFVVVYRQKEINF